MARTYAIGCRDCGVSKWVGQGPNDHTGGYLYQGEHGPKLWAFLRAHQGHSLVFDDDQCEPLDEMQDVETAEEDAATLAAGRAP